MVGFPLPVKIICLHIIFFSDIILCHSVFMLRNSNYLRDLEKTGYKTGYKIYLLHVILDAVSVGVTSL